MQRFPVDSAVTARDPRSGLCPLLENNWIVFKCGDYMIVILARKGHYDDWEQKIPTPRRGSRRLRRGVFIKFPSRFYVSGVSKRKSIGI